MMMRGARRPLNDRVTRARGAVITPVLATMVSAGGLQVLCLVATASAAPQEVGAAAQEVRPGTTAPLQLLQFRAVILRAAGHASGIRFVRPAKQIQTNGQRRKGC